MKLPMKVLWLASHPIQYQAPLFRELARRCDLLVAYAHRQSAAQQGNAGYGIAFDWDVNLLSGYRSVFLAPSSRQPSIERFWRCRSAEVAPLIERERPDTVVLGGWNLLVYWQALRAARRQGIPVLARTDSRSRPADSAPRRALRTLALRRFSGYLAAGVRSSEYLRSHGVAVTRIFVCPHTVDVERFARSRARSAQARASLRAGLGLPADSFIAVFVGRLIGLKRPGDLLEALAAARLPSRAQAVFVGSGPLAEGLARRAGELGVNARFAGFRNQSELPDWLAAADVLVLPSAAETWGMVVNEALAAGCPAIVSSGAGCAADFAAHAPAVRVYPAGDIAALARALEAAASTPVAQVEPALDAAVAQFAPAHAAAQVIAAVAALRERG
ncbi:MAG: glycosyltransferase [Nevskiaceae bacterium]